MFYDISGHLSGLPESFLSNRRLHVVLDPTLFLLYIDDLPDYVICTFQSMLMIPLSILSVSGHFICDNN